MERLRLVLRPFTRSSLLWPSCLLSWYQVRALLSFHPVHAYLVLPTGRLVFVPFLRLHTPRSHPTIS
jgi:hypothetical protein